MRESVLLINFQEEDKLKALKRIFVSQKIRIRTVTKDDYGQTIGYLAGAKEQEEQVEPYQGEDLTNELIVFAALSDKKLNDVLMAMRKGNIRVPYKAILTPTNQSWTVPELYHEIASEHEAMSGGNPS